MYYAPSLASEKREIGDYAAHVATRISALLMLRAARMINGGLFTTDNFIGLQVFLELLRFPILGCLGLQLQLTISCKDLLRLDMNPAPVESLNFGTRKLLFMRTIMVLLTWQDSASSGEDGSASQEN